MEYPVPTTRGLTLFWPDVEFHNLHINHDKLDWLKAFDILDCHREVDDFDLFLDTVWTVSVHEKVSGESSIIAADNLNGLAVLTTGSGINNWIEAIWPNETWQLIAGYPLLFAARVSVADADKCGAWVGLVKKPGWYAGTTDYVVFWKPATNATLLFSYCKNGAAVNIDTGIGAVDDDFIRLYFHFDGQGALRWFVMKDEDYPQTCLAAGEVVAPIVAGVPCVPWPDDELLTKGFGARTGEADHNMAFIDFLKVAQKRAFEP